MRILIGTGLNAGPAEYQNIGDVAMLQVAVTRLHELWPQAEILVLTDSPPDLERFCPAAQPLSRFGAETWICDRILLGGLHHQVPESFSSRLDSIRRKLTHRWPALLEAMMRARFRLQDSSGRVAKLQSFLKAFRSCDLLIICGSGGFADSCIDWNLFTLGLVEAALAQGARAVLLGQGIGPLADERTLERMRQVLPRVAMLSSRGTSGATALARQIGIPDSIIVTTGDEAVEPAYESRSPFPGHSIGVNLRVAPYSGVSQAQADAIATILRDFALRQKSDLVPLPIAFHPYADDRESIRRLIGHPASRERLAGLDSPQSLYVQTARCRVVVTGAYHAAVFALSQGIPTVCLYASEFYAAKFQGLQALFGDGCALVNLKDKNMESLLSHSLDDYWNRAEVLRPGLLQGARFQISASREACRRIRDLFPVEMHKAAPTPAALSIP